MARSAVTGLRNRLRTARRSPQPLKGEAAALWGASSSTGTLSAATAPPQPQAPPAEAAAPVDTAPARSAPRAWVLALTAGLLIEELLQRLWLVAAKITAAGFPGPHRPGRGARCRNADGAVGSVKPSCGRSPSAILTVEDGGEKREISSAASNCARPRSIIARRRDRGISAQIFRDEQSLYRGRRDSQHGAGGSGTGRTLQGPNDEQEHHPWSNGARAFRIQPRESRPASPLDTAKAVPQRPRPALQPRRGSVDSPAPARVSGGAPPPPPIVDPLPKIPKRRSF